MRANQLSSRHERICKSITFFGAGGGALCPGQDGADGRDLLKPAGSAGQLQLNPQASELCGSWVKAGPPV